MFPDIYDISRLKFVSVAAMGGWSDGGWKWGNFGVSEGDVVDMGVEEEFAVFKGRMEDFRGWMDGKDSVEWNAPEEAEFTVASCYNFYNNLRIPFGPSNRYDGVYELLWKLDVPFKIKAFGWRLFLNRLPVKDLLEIRGIHFPLDELKCLFCDNSLENSNHLFFSCLVVKIIWNEIARWVGKGDTVVEECLSSYFYWHNFFVSKKVKVRKLGVVWLATTWIIWLVRNGGYFRKEAWNVNNTV
ncbi:uncharacterized protein LOC131597454 [Vicia villosa]|uniref:uncharacterized protein LOC131597454 n=1 Tax=Vicia villosa TaxID=3911 RepID=UPI00273B79A9|nr:uncharacterized protein LOC131597454 [Vicia villosa]